MAKDPMEKLCTQVKKLRREVKKLIERTEQLKHTTLTEIAKLRKNGDSDKSEGKPEEPTE